MVLDIELLKLRFEHFSDASNIGYMKKSNPTSFGYVKVQVEMAVKPVKTKCIFFVCLF